MGDSPVSVMKDCPLVWDRRLIDEYSTFRYVTDPAF